MKTTAGATSTTPSTRSPARPSTCARRGRPGGYRLALLAYNHSTAYGNEVLDWARRYRVAAQQVAAAPSGVVRRPLLGRWLAPAPGTTVQCDARIVDDVVFLLERFGLIASDCFSTSSVHKALGEHPLGRALDAVPQGGDWRRTMAAARAFGWAERCASSGCEGRLRGPFRVILYNGFPGHRDPAHCACGGNAHIHFSWRHSPARPFTVAAWVEAMAR